MLSPMDSMWTPHTVHRALSSLYSQTESEENRQSCPRAFNGNGVHDSTGVSTIWCPDRRSSSDRVPTGFVHRSSRTDKTGVFLVYRILFHNLNMCIEMLLHCFSWVGAGVLIILLIVLKPPSPSPSVDFHILISPNHLHKNRWLCLYCSSSYWAGVWSLNPPCLLFVPHRNSGWPLGSNPGTGSLMLLVTLRLHQKWRIFKKLFPFLCLPKPPSSIYRNPGQQLGLSVKTGSSKPISWYLQMRPQGLTFEKK